MTKHAKQDSSKPRLRRLCRLYFAARMHSCWGNYLFSLFSVSILRDVAMLNHSSQLHVSNSPNYYKHFQTHLILKVFWKAITVQRLITKFWFNRLWATAYLRFLCLLRLISLRWSVSLPVALHLVNRIFATRCGVVPRIKAQTTINPG